MNRVKTFSWVFKYWAIGMVVMLWGTLQAATGLDDRPSPETVSEIADIENKVSKNRLVCVVGAGTTEITLQGDSNRKTRLKTAPEKNLWASNIHIFTGCNFYRSFFVRIDGVSVNDGTRQELSYENEEYNQVKYIGLSGSVGYEYYPIDMISLQLAVGYRNSQYILYSDQHTNRTKPGQHETVIAAVVNLHVSDLFLEINYFGSTDSDNIFVSQAGIAFGVLY